MHVGDPGETGLVGTAMYVSPELLKQDVRYTQVLMYINCSGVATWMHAFCLLFLIAESWHLQRRYHLLWDVSPSTSHCHGETQDVGGHQEEGDRLPVNIWQRKAKSGLLCSRESARDDNEGLSVNSSSLFKGNSAHVMYMNIIEMCCYTYSCGWSINIEYDS